MMSEKNFAISVSNLSKSYGTVKALDNVSFELRKNEILGLLGPNGAGKTTAIHIVLGLLSPTSGTVQVLGMNPQMERDKMAARINFSSAYGSLPHNLKVRENLGIFAGLYGLKASWKKIDRLLQVFEIDHLKNHLTGALSSGEKTRLNLVKSLINDPEVLFLDEPTASLDPHIADKVRTVLNTIQREKGISILYTSHNMHEVEELCDRVVFIHHGKKMAEGTAQEIRTQCAAETLHDAFIEMVRGENKE